MLNRRSRIKGIANIPQRRKIETTNSNAPTQESLPTNTSELLSGKLEQENVSENVKIVEDSEDIVIVKPKTLTPKVSFKRTFIKPTVNVKVLDLHKRRSETNDVKNSATITQEDQVSSIVDSASSNLESSQVNPTNEGEGNDKLVECTINKSVPVEIITETNDINETFVKPTVSLKVQRQKNDSISSFEGIANDLLSPTHNVTGSDGEYSESSNLTKTVNRTRIKAIPRFSNRRLSVSLQHGSASESEDDSKRTNQRVRTESTSIAPPVNEHDTSVQKVKEFSSIVQKKCKRSEQSRKMAEARREFNSKFGKNIPDKQKLTMMDLIFYNPINNPMSKKLKKPKKAKEEEEEEELQKEDDPSTTIDDKEEESEIPAPRIKIGADGEIVIDEQSLVIENASLKRGREELEKAEVVDGDLETSYGVYKRHKRTKDWTNEDTMLFYRALNTLGTDFTLMTQLFPNRSRKELKMKFKKEERINSSLIDKALTQPVQFNIVDLKEEVKNRENKAKRSQNVMLKINHNVPYRNTVKIPAHKRRCQRLKREKQTLKKTQIGIKKFLVLSDEENENEESSDSNSNDNIPDKSSEVTESVVATPQIDVDKDETMQPLEPGSLMIVTSTTPSGMQQMEVFMVTPNSDNAVKNTSIAEENT